MYECNTELSTVIISVVFGVFITLYFVALYVFCKTNCFSNKSNMKEFNYYRRVFKKANLLVDEDHVELLDSEILGEGHSAGVKMGYIKKHIISSALGYRGPKLLIKIPVAIKVINPNRQSPQELLKEALIMSQITNSSDPRCAHFVTLMGVCFIKHNVPLILMQPMAQNLKDFLITSRFKNNPNVTVGNLCKVMIQLCKAVNYMHEVGFVHRDLAARNVMLTELGSLQTVKLSDFGLSRTTEGVAPTKLNQDVPLTNYYTEKVNTRELPLSYMPPEWFICRHHYLRSDVWMLGILAWEICCYGLPPNRNLDYTSYITQTEIMDAICSLDDDKRFLPISTNVPLQIRTLLKECWARSPNERPSALQLKEKFEQLLNHRQLTNIILPIENIEDIIQSQTSQHILSNHNIYSIPVTRGEIRSDPRQLSISSDRTNSCICIFGNEIPYLLESPLSEEFERRGSLPEDIDLSGTDDKGPPTPKHYKKRLKKAYSDATKTRGYENTISANTHSTIQTDPYLKLRSQQLSAPILVMKIASNEETISNGCASFTVERPTKQQSLYNESNLDKTTDSGISMSPVGDHCMYATAPSNQNYSSEQTLINHQEERF